MKRTSRKGFTLIELIVTIVILGILAALAVPAFQAVIERSKKNSLAQGANSIAREAHALAAFEQANPLVPFGFDNTTADGTAVPADAEIVADLPSGVTVVKSSKTVTNDNGTPADTTDDFTVTTHGINVSDTAYEVFVYLGESAGVYSPVSGSDVTAK